MISIDVTSLNDLAEVEKAIEKLSFVRDALKKAENTRAKVRELADRDDIAAYAKKIIAENIRGSGLTPYQIVYRNAFGEAFTKPDDEIVTRLDELTPDDLDEMNAGPAVWPKLKPVMDPQDAIQDDGIICLIDGKKRKFLERYVRQVHHMAWGRYLERFDLPGDYPKVCKDLLDQRRKAAIDQGFGIHHRDQEPEQHVHVTVPIRTTFGRRPVSQQVSLQMEIGGSVVKAATDRDDAKSLALSLRGFL